MPLHLIEKVISNSFVVKTLQKLNIQLGRYRRGDEWDVVDSGTNLGEGSMGSCVLAWDTVSKRRFCAKQVRLTLYISVIVSPVRAIV